MTGRVGIHDEPVLRGGVGAAGGVEHARADGDGMRMGSRDVGDREVEMDLLRLPVGPLRGHVAGGVLDADPETGARLHRVPVVVPAGDLAVEQGGPERRVTLEVCAVEDDLVESDLWRWHGLLLGAAPHCRGHSRL